MNREEVYGMFASEVQGLGKPTPTVPDYPDITDHGLRGGNIFSFGIYWNKTPTRLSVVEYGPTPNYEFVDGRLVATSYDPSKYTCYAS